MSESLPPDLPCITLWNPWAAWVRDELKPIESRTHRRFACLVGKRIGIHAGVRHDIHAVNFARRWITLPKVNNYVGGCLICTVFVEDARPLTAADEAGALIECTSTKRFGLFLQDVRKLAEPIEMKGGRGIFYPFRKKGAVHSRRAARELSNFLGAGEGEQEQMERLRGRGMHGGCC